MQVAISYSDSVQQVWLTLEVPANADLRTAIDASGILKMIPDINLETNKVGVFGRLSKLDAGLRPGDRVEIYRPLICDPEAVPRRDKTKMDAD